MTDRVLTRVVRRETHSPRTAVTVVVLILIAVAAAYTATEIVLRLSGAAPLLATPGEALAWIRALPDEQPQSGVIAGAAAVALVGVVLLWFAIAPGRRAKHALAVLDHAVVVDNGVIASAIAERVRRASDLPRGAATVGVGHRAVDVTVRPEQGQTIDRAHVRSIAEEELERYALTPRVKVRVRVQQPAEGEGSS